jgi:hypothetical protein
MVKVLAETFSNPDKKMGTQGIGFTNDNTS